MQNLTGVFQIEGPDPGKHSILDFRMAPGGFLATALRINPEARALGFSLPTFKGDHRVLLPRNPNVTLKFLDITMLATDMGLKNLPCDHPDAKNSLFSHFKQDQYFDLVLCDGQVLRNHERAAYRKDNEASRLTLTQLILGLGHIKPGGTMIVLLHKVEAQNTVRLLYTFEKFASVQLFKHPKIHTKRSSFYMLATNIRADCQEMAIAIEQWKMLWKTATFGLENVEPGVIYENPDLEVVLEEFGPKFRKKHQQSRLMEREHKKMKLKQTISLLRSKMQSRPWYLAQTTYQGNQQHIERLLIEILPFYRVSRQHRVNMLKIAAMIQLTLSAVSMRCSREGQMAALRFSLIYH